MDVLTEFTASVPTQANISCVILQFSKFIEQMGEFHGSEKPKNVQCLVNSKFSHCKHETKRKRKTDFVLNPSSGLNSEERRKNTRTTFYVCKRTRKMRGKKRGWRKKATKLVLQTEITSRKWYVFLIFLFLFMPLKAFFSIIYVLFTSTVRWHLESAQSWRVICANVCRCVFLCALQDVNIVGRIFIQERERESKKRANEKIDC